MSLPPPEPPDPPDEVESSSVADEQFAHPHGLHQFGLRTGLLVGTALIWGASAFLWLLALRSSQWSAVFFVGPIPALVASSIWQEWGNCLTEIPHPSAASAAVGLFSSGASTLRDALDHGPTDMPRLGVALDVPRWFSRLKAHVQERHSTARWFQVHHRDVGGVTAHSARFITIDAASFSVPASVPHTLGSIISHKLFVPGTAAVESSLSQSDLLPVQDPLAKICLPCHFGLSGFGLRSLHIQEFGAAWDMPLWSAFQPTKASFDFISSLVPMKTLVAASDAFLATLQLKFSSEGGNPLPALTVAPGDSRGVWLPSLNVWLLHDWMDVSLLTAKAAKADNSGIPVHLWNQWVSLALQTPSCTLPTIQNCMFGWTCRRVVTSFCQHMMDTHGSLGTSFRDGTTPGFPGGQQSGGEEGTVATRARLAFRRDLECGTRAIKYFLDSSWWKWDRGSALLFWRWPTPESRTAARDGWPFFVTDKLPTYGGCGQPPSPNVRSTLAKKIEDLLCKSYVEPITEVTAHIDHFGVPKTASPDGEALDIRVVWHGSSSGLNQSLWAPNFPLPTTDTALRQVSYLCESADFDMGEMFLNFS